MLVYLVFLGYPRKWVNFTSSYPAFAKEGVTDSDIRGVSMSFKMSPIPRDMNQDWEVTIDGVRILTSFIQVKNDRYGEFTYGLRPEGYPSWVFHEVGGGGAVTLPFTFNKDGDLLVGLLSEYRPNMGTGTHLCVVGGMKDPNETHAQAQTREAEEEAGLGDLEVLELEGVPSNSNRLFWVADLSAGEGVHAWCMRIPFEWLTSDEEGLYRITRADTEAMKQRLGKARSVVFMHWHVAAKKTADVFARAAILQLLAMHHENSLL